MAVAVGVALAVPITLLASAGVAEEPLPDGGPAAQQLVESSRASVAVPLSLEPRAVAKSDPRLDTRVMDEVDLAMETGQWQLVQELVRQLPDWRSSLAVEQILAQMPAEIARRLPEPAMSEAAEEAHLVASERRLEADRDRLRVARATQDLPSDEPPAPDYSLSGRVPHELGLVLPGAGPTEAVLTVGDGCTFADLQTAVDQAASGDTIWVQGKRFTGPAATVNLSGKTLFVVGGFDAACTARDGSRTVLDATGEADSVVEVSGSSSFAVLLDRVDLTGGEVDADLGGGLEISADAAVTLQDCTVHGNASSYGGGVHMTAGTLTLGRGTRLGDNSATADGGGVYALDAVVVVDGGWVGSAVLGGNRADSDGDGAGNGGGVFLDHSRLVLGSATTAAHVDSNRAVSGGGIYAGNGSSVSLAGSRAQLRRNQAAADGGGIAVDDTSVVWVGGGHVDDNLADSNGGGLHVSGAGAVVMVDGDGACDGARCFTVAGNQALLGGGVFVAGGATLELARARLEGNAANQGSAAYAAKEGTTVRLASLVVAGNDGARPVRLNAVVGATLDSSTVAHNTGCGDAVVGLADGAELEAHALIVWGNDATALASGAFTLSDSIEQYGVGGVNNRTVDPLFVDPRGGNYNISSSSPAVDHSPRGAARDVGNGVRPVGAGYDAGANELAARVGINGAACEYGSIGDAIVAATAGDTLYVAPGAYLERLTIDKNLSVTQATVDCTAANPSSVPTAVTVDADDSSVGNGGVVYILPGPTAVTLSKLHLTDGTASNGGGMYVPSSTTVTLDDVWMSDSEASGAGGGVRCWGTLHLTGSTRVIGNRATGTAYGGGISVPSSGTLIMDDDAEIGARGAANTSSTWGGGVAASGGGVVQVGRASSVSYNEATGDGGGIDLRGGSRLELSDNARVANNTATADGGGIAAADGASVEILGPAQVSDNTAANGGGIQVENGATNPVQVVVADGASIDDNLASTLGGGINLHSDAGASAITITASAVNGNSASTGGGLTLNSVGATLTTQGSSISYNTAGIGGGLVLGEGSTAKLMATKLDSNSAQSCGGAYNVGGTLEVYATGGDASVSGNRAVSGSGGGICHLAPNNLKMYATTGLYAISVVGNSAQQDGGGLYLSGSRLDTYGRVRYVGNTAGTNGGAVYALNSPRAWFDDYVTDQPLLSGNTAAGGSGGGIWAEGSAFEFDGVDLAGNSAGVYGGGVFASGGSLKMDFMSITGNEAVSRGGGLYLSAGAAATVTTTLPTPALAGGDSHDSSSARATTCDPSALPADTYCFELRDNRTSSPTGYGGAVCVAEGSSFTAENLAFVDNTAGYGSALYSLSAGDSIALLNARISGNVSSSSAVRVFSTGSLELDSCTLAGNTGTAVSVSNAGATVSFDSSIIWGNASGVSSSAAIVGNGCNISQNGVGGAAVDPLFATTERGDYHLGAGSPAVDACVAGPASDLDNRARPWGSAHDMGAFERWVVPDIFADGFELGSTSAWSNAVP